MAVAPADGADVSEEVNQTDITPASVAAPPAPDIPAAQGELAASAQSQKYRFSRRIVSLSEPESDATESIRSLRAHLMAGHVRYGRRSLATCGPNADAGSTLVAVNLAVAFAQAGVNTLLIDANLRAPGVNKFIEPARAPGGLRKMLEDGDTLGADEVRRSVLPNLSILYAGEATRGASELIANRSFKTIIDDCMRDFEFTIVDAPTEHGHSDTRRVAMTLRYAMVIARRDRSYLSQVRELVNHLSTDKVQIVGTFLTEF
jgi:Mrp family chromosome partitioning ATPase